MDNKSLQISRVLDAPVALVWEAWSKPEHIAQWWGPTGFTNTIEIMDFQVNGEWRFMMHGPDGKNYPNRSFFKEIIEFKKIVFEHFNPHFMTTVLFESMGEKTKIDWTVVFDNEAVLKAVIEAHQADKGLSQNLDKLEAFLNLKP